MSNENVISSRIKELRTGLNLTQSQFADSLNISTVSISSYETGAKTPSFDMVFNIAQKYNISIDWLCGLSEKKQRSFEIETYSDLINVLIQMVEVSDLGTTNEVRYTYENPETTYKIASVNFDNQTIVDFFSEWHDVTQLCKKSPSGKKLYSIWLKDIEERYNIPIKSEPTQRDYEQPFT